MRRGVNSRREIQKRKVKIRTTAKTAAMRHPASKRLAGAPANTTICLLGC
jgi:hypothetical protein